MCSGTCSAPRGALIGTATPVHRGTTLLTSIAAYEQLQIHANDDGHNTLLQIGEAVCPRSVLLASEIRTLRKEQRFEWLYADAHDSVDLVEHIGILALPGFVMFSPHREPLLVADATTHRLRFAVRTRCAPILRLDLDF